MQTEVRELFASPKRSRTEMIKEEQVWDRVLDHHHKGTRSVYTTRHTVDPKDICGVKWITHFPEDEANMVWSGNSN